MNINREKAAFLNKMILHWENKKIINQETAAQLKESYQIKTFDWRKLAQNSIYIALACCVISLFTLLVDKKVLDFLSKLYYTPDYVISILSFLFAGIITYFSYKRSLNKPKEHLTNDALLFIGMLLIANGLAYLAKSIPFVSDRISILFLLGIVIYSGLTYALKSRLIWLFALISFACCFIAETAYITKDEKLLFGTNFPIRFTLFGCLTIGLAYLLKDRKNTQNLFKTTYFVGLFYTFSALYLVSLFGNYSSLNDWYRINQLHFWPWALISIVICTITAYLGHKYANQLAKEFGVSFLIINLYSRYFEYFWEPLHSSIFFLILALSFWLIGRKAEKIWNLEFLKK